MSDKLADIVKEIINCRRCPLHISRKNPVPGEGPVPSPIMLVGEAPGAQEDEAGRPFVGPAGKLLERAMKEVGLDRKKAYITNVVKCRPPNNRVPYFTEVKECIGYLISQLNIVRPKVVIALGSTALTYLFAIDRLIKNARKPELLSVSKMRGSYYVKSTGVTTFYLVPTYHPAGVLRKRSLWNLLVSDLELARSLLEKPRPNKKPDGQSTLPL